MNARPSLYLFNWPSHVGGADTKVAHLLLHRHYDGAELARAVAATGLAQVLHRGGVKALLADLPRKLRGTALSLCNGEFFAGGVACEAKCRGLRIVWSSEMMRHRAHFYIRLTIFRVRHTRT